MVTMDAGSGSSVGVGQTVPELGWGNASVPHSSLPTWLPAPETLLLHHRIFILLSTVFKAEGHLQWVLYYTPTLHLVYMIKQAQQISKTDGIKLMCITQK